MKIYRIEDDAGRGPFKPGFSHVWRSPRGKDFPPPWEEAALSLGEFQKLFSEHGFQGGCGCRSLAQLKEWFTLTERLRLRKLGYKVVSFEPDRILLETPTQVIFERRVA